MQSRQHKLPFKLKMEGNYICKKESIITFKKTLVNTNIDMTVLELLDNETVQIMFNDGGRRKVNITADSYGAIILDVIKHCF